MSPKTHSTFTLLKEMVIFTNTAMGDQLTPIHSHAHLKLQYIAGIHNHLCSIAGRRLQLPLLSQPVTFTYAASCTAYLSHARPGVLLVQVAEARFTVNGSLAEPRLLVAPRSDVNMGGIHTQTSGSKVIGSCA